MNWTLRSTGAAVALGIALMACGSDPSTSLADNEVVAVTSTTEPANNPTTTLDELVATEGTDLDNTGVTVPTDTDTDTDTEADTEAEAEADTDAGSQTVTAVPESRDLRDVDFFNNMMFIDHDNGGQLGPVVDGQFFNGEFGDDDYFAFFVNDVVFVDLDSDGQEEAVVQAALNGGGSGFFDELRSFAIEGDDIVETSVSYFGDRAFGGIAQITADPVGWTVGVDVFVDGEGSCCPHTVAAEEFEWLDGELVALPSFAPFRYMNLDQGTETELTFIAGSDHAMLGMPAGTESTVRFGALAGQFIEVDHNGGPSVSAATVTHLETNETVAVDGKTPLPADGLFELSLTTEDAASINDIANNTTVIVTIGAPINPAPTEVEWVLTDVVEVVQSEPVEVEASASLPSFPNYPNATTAVSQFVDGLFDPWIEYAQAAEIPSEDIGGSFELTPRVGLSTPSLVSVEFEFSEYLCCRPHPIDGTRSVVFNPSSGVALANGEIVDLSRVEEIERIWFDALATNEFFDQDVNLEETFTELDTGLRWSALSVESNGLTFGTDRSGPYPGTSTFVSFDDLGDLVMPTVLNAVR